MDINHHINTATTAYTDNIIARAVISSIPYIGSAIDVLISGKATKIQSERINKAIDSLTSEISKLKKEQINENYLVSEDFYDDIVVFLEKSQKTKSTLKIDAYTKILCSRISGEIKEIEIHQLLESIYELTETELIALREIYQFTKTKEAESLKHSNSIKKTHINDVLLKNILVDFLVADTDYIYILMKLENGGFVKEDVGTYAGYSGGSCFITNTTRRIFQFILK